MASFHFRRILSAFKTPTYKLGKLLLPILESLTVYKYTVKHSFDFVNEIFIKIPVTSWVAYTLTFY